jgi:thiol:disulfide interchange protein DsbD
VAALVFCGLLVAASSRGAGKGGDPFATNQAVAVGKATDPKPPQSSKGIDFRVEAAPATVRRGETVQLRIIGTPKPGYHTYPVTQRANNKEQSEEQLSKIVFDDPAGLVPLYPVHEPEPQREELEGLGTILQYTERFTWSQDLAVPEKLDPGVKTLRFHVRVIVCYKSKCFPADNHQFEVPLTVSDAAAVTPSEDIAARLKPPPIQVVSVNAPGPESTPAAPAPSRTTEAAAPPVAAPLPDTAAEHKADLDAILHQLQGDPPAAAGNTGLLAFVLQGILWGFVTLLTPCVFPMIPITVSFFIKESEKANRRPLLQALVYSGTIVTVLTIAAVALLSFFRWLSVTPAMNFVLGALFIYLALSLFGMYDIQLPSFLTRYTSAGESRGGMLGTVFMALTFTIVSFACVAPFLGGFGGTAAGSGITFWHRVLGGLAFAATFASPFFFLALFPSLLKRLPRSGSWMNTVKVVMGFLEFAAALKFLRAGELVLLPQPVFFTYDLVLGIYVALAVLAGLYLIQVFRLPHDEPAETISVPRFVVAVLFLSLALYIAPALFKGGGDQNQRPSGQVYAWVDAFLLPDPTQGREELAWTGNLKAALDAARAAPAKDRKLVFLDFTGETCTNCKLNEKNVFPKADVKELLQRYQLARLYTDKVPDEFYSAAVRGQFGSSTSRQREDAANNLDFQRAAFGTEQLPLYVILEPKADGTIAVLGRYDEGKINSEAAFAEFLRKPLGG